ncbi:MAG: hypothetical protein QW046_05890 [Candidatus Micrarchaeaceae archaeon]
MTPGSTLSVSFPTTVLPVPTKLHFSGYALLSSAQPVNVYYQVINVRSGSYYSVYINYQLENNGTIINIPDQEIVLEPYAYTAIANGPYSGITIQALATVTVVNFYARAYVEVPEE